MSLLSEAAIVPEIYRFDGKNTADVDYMYRDKRLKPQQQNMTHESTENLYVGGPLWPPSFLLLTDWQKFIDPSGRINHPFFFVFKKKVIRSNEDKVTT